MAGKIAVYLSLKFFGKSFPKERAFSSFSKSKNPLKKSKKKNAGQALVEYAMLLSIAASIAIGFNAFFRRTVGFGILRFNAVLESELRTGEFENPSTVGMWEN